MATRYWVNGNGTWGGSVTTNWSSSSGGANGASVPTSSDDVIFDNNSGVGTFTVTVSGSIQCKDITFNQNNRTLTCTGNGGTLTISGNLYMGNFALFTGNAFFTSGNIVFTAPSGSKVFEAKGRSFCTSSSYVLRILIDPASSLTLTGSLSTGYLNLSSGTFDINGQTVNVQKFLSSNTSTRVLNFNNGNIVVAGYVTGAIGVECSTVTGFTTDQLGEIQIGLATGGSTFLNSNCKIQIGAMPESSALNINVNTTTTATFEQSVTVNNLTTIVSSRITISSFIYTLSIYGNLTCNGNCSISGIVVFKSTGGPKTILLPSSLLLGGIQLDGVGGSWQLSSNATLNGALTLTNGSFDANDYNVTATNFVSSNTNTRQLYMGSGTWTITSSSTVWNCATSTGLNVTPETAVISLTSTSSKTFAGGGKTWPTLRQTGTGQLTITGSNSFTDIQNTVQPCTVLFEAGSTNTFDSDFSLSGTGTAARVTIGSTASPSPFYLEASFGEVSVVYCSLSNSRVISPNKWYALLNQGNLNTGGNEGWIFSLVSPGAFLAFF
jgi:hypothetical protein